MKLDISQELPFLFADRDRIQQVMTNLLGNAIKFSFEGGEIRSWADPKTKDLPVLIISMV